MQKQNQRTCKWDGDSVGEKAGKGGWGRRDGVHTYMKLPKSKFIIIKKKRKLKAIKTQAYLCMFMSLCLFVCTYVCVFVCVCVDSLSSY